MAELNETPRQKMMGILYLVLLGLAATTVTDHVLDAFQNLTDSLKETSKLVGESTENRFKSFEERDLKNSPDRSKPFYDRAKKVQTICKDLDKIIDADIKELIEKGEGLKPNGEVNKRDDIEISPNVMIVHKKAIELKAKIKETIVGIKSCLDAKDTANTTVSLNVKDPAPREGIKTSWEEDAFGDGIPLTAALTALAKIKSDLKSSENSVVRKILANSIETDLVLDEYKVIAVPKSNYILVGQKYEAEVFLTAFDSKKNPEITVNGQKLEVKDGKGLYTAAGTAPGDKKYTGTITVQTTDGHKKDYPLEEQVYKVAPPSVTISPTAMNVFYIGVPNPVAIGAAGVADDKVHATISDGTITPVSGQVGKYEVNVKNMGKVTITASGELEKGHSSVLGTGEFRCKRIPSPHPTFGGKGGGNVPLGALKGQTKLFAKLEDFDFDAKFVVNTFKLIVIKPRGGDPQVLQANSGNLTPEMIAAINGITPSTRVMFDNIVATGPDGVKKSLDPITFTAQ